MMDTVEFVKSFQSSSVLELDGIKRLMNALGNPEKDLKYIHVAGTNGKGSVCAFILSILKKAGLKCGKFSSPALISQEDCISVNGESITSNKFKDVLNKIEPKISGQSQFEVLTAAAFYYFKSEKCDIVILECGMGGIGDATNIIPPPVCGVITRIDIDHTAYLGDNISEIARNKCGILKNGTEHTITIDQPATDIIKNYSKGVFHIAEPTDLPLSLLGKHQKENAGIAISVCRALEIDDDIIRKGLLEAKHPGRFEKFNLIPPIIYDGAHNPGGARVLCDNLPNGEITLICAFMADKDIESIFSYFKENGINKRAVFYCTTVTDNPRAMETSALKQIAEKFGFNAKAYKSVKHALKDRKSNTIVFGSLYLYKEFRDAIRELYGL